MSESPDELRSRVTALEAENAALRASTVPGDRPPRRSRTVVAIVLILLGVLLAPVAVVTGWAKWTLTDTERFVATYAPLARSQEVQSYVVEQAMAAVEQRADFAALTSEVVDGIVGLGTGPRATAALRSLQGSLADALRSQVEGAMTEFVTSDLFAAAWAESLRVGHEQLIGTLQNDPAAVARIGEDGSVGIPLGPIVERVKEQLVARGLSVADRIPPVDRTITLVRSDYLPAVQLAYGMVVGLGTWLPWVVLALLVGGVAAANRRHRALLWAAGAFAFTMAVVALAIAAGRIALVAAVPASVLPGSVSTLFYDAATGAMQSTAVSAAVLAVAVGVVGWLAGPFRTTTRLRGLELEGAARLRAIAAERGVTTGRVGVWVHARRSLLFGLIALVAGAVIVLNTPATVALVGWTAFWSALAVVAVTLIERPETTAESELTGTAVVAASAAPPADERHPATP